MEYKWRALIAVCFGVYLAGMDFSIVNVALPTLSREFHQPADVVVWATLAHNLMVTGFTLTAGRAGDLFGRKRFYLAGWALFTLGMAGAALSGSIVQLIATRLVQAGGVALIVANGNAIVADAFPANQRGQSLGTTTAVVSAGLMSGPVLGGLILDHMDWHALFYLRVPLSIAAFSLAAVLVRPSETSAGGAGKLDIKGAVAIFFALCPLILALNRGTAWGWTSPEIVGLLAVGIGSLLLFLRIESREAAPIISLALFRARSFTISIVALFLSFLTQSSVTFLMPFYLINVHGYSAGYSGLLLAAIPAVSMALSPISGYFYDRFGYRHQITVGLLLCAIGAYSLVTLSADSAAPAIALRMAVIGAGIAVFSSPNSSLIMQSVPRSMFGTASASMGTARNIGMALGLAVASTLFVIVGSDGRGGVPVEDLASGEILSGARAGLFAGGCFALLASIATFVYGRARASNVVEEVASADPLQR